MHTNTGRGLAPGTRDGLMGAGLLLGFLLIYLRTLCPTVYLGDVGDFCTAIVTGGVPHPPGYPLFSLLGRAALWLVPVGEPAFRIGCVVVLAAAAAVAVLYYLARECGCSPWAAATGAVVYGMSFTFWSQSTRVEVYSLHVLLAALMLLFALRYQRTGRLGDLAAAALAGSLGLANHLTIALQVPALLLLCGRRLVKDPGLSRRLAVLGALLPVGPALYLLLLVWARAEPLHAWGHTVTLPLLWNHASARICRILLFHIPSGPELVAELSRAGVLFRDNFPSTLSFLPVLGAIAFLKRDGRRGGALLLGAAIVTAYNTCYPILDIAGYYLVPWMVAAVFFGAAVDLLSRSVAQRCRLREGEAPAEPGSGIPDAGVMPDMGSAGASPSRKTAPLVRRVGEWVSPAVCAVLLGVLLVRNWGACDLSRATWVREFARQKLESVEPKGVLLSRGLEDTFPIWYLQSALHVRPDVVAVDQVEIKFLTLLRPWEPSLWYLHRLRRQGVEVAIRIPEDLPVNPATREPEYLPYLLDGALRGRPVYATSTILTRAPNDLVNLQRSYNLLPFGPILRLQPRDRPVDLEDLLRHNERIWSRIALPDVGRVRTDQETEKAYVPHQYVAMLLHFGHLHERAGNLERAAGIYRRALELMPGSRAASEALADVCRKERPRRGTPALYKGEGA